MKCCKRYSRILTTPNTALPEEVDAALDFENESLSDLNEMCRAIEQLSPADHEKLGAVVAIVANT